MKKNSFVEGTIIATVAIVIVKILGMLYIVPFYATVGPQGSALYGYAYNIYNLFLEISTAGLPIAMSKVINEYNTLGLQEAKMRAFGLGKRVINAISLICFVVLFVFAREIALLIIGDLTGGNTITDVAFVIRCVSFAVLIIPFLSVTRGFFQGHKYIGPSSVSQIIEQVVRIFVILVGSYLAYKVFDIGLNNAVGIAVFGAFLGGFAAFIYLSVKIKKNKDKLKIKKFEKKDEVTNKQIIKKIVQYATPFIIINIAVSVYSFTNMVLILRTLDYLKYTGPDAEFITNAITTLGSKLNMIVGAVASGMTISLIPNIVSSFVKKDWKDVNNKINKAFQIVIILSIPMTIGLSMLAKPVWTAFYGVSELGPVIFKVSVFTVLFSNLSMVTNSTLHGINQYKTIYLSTLVGFLLNAVLDVPLMLLFNYIGLPPYYGAIVSTIIGYSWSIIIATNRIRKNKEIHFKETLYMTLKTMVPTIAMILVLLGISLVYNYNELSRYSSVLYILVNTFAGGLVYFFVSYKMGLIEKIFGKEMLKKITKKLTFKKDKQLVK